MTALVLQVTDATAAPIWGVPKVSTIPSDSKEKLAKDEDANDYIAGSSQDQSQGLQRLGGAAMMVSTTPDPEHFGDSLPRLQPEGKQVLVPGMLNLLSRHVCIGTRIVNHA